MGNSRADVGYLDPRASHPHAVNGTHIFRVFGALIFEKFFVHPNIFENERPKNRKNVCPIHGVGATRADPSSQRLPLEFPPVDRSRRENHQEISTKNVSPKILGAQRYRTKNSGRARNLSHTIRRAHRREPCRRKPGLGEPQFHGPCRWSCLGLCLTLA